jgi:putative endonuclease
MPPTITTEFTELKSWFIYIIRCADDSLYTGVTTDLERRINEHNAGKTAARYTRARRPVSLVYQESAPDRTTACRREYQIKQLSRLEKQRLLVSFHSSDHHGTNHHNSDRQSSS